MSSAAPLVKAALVSTLTTLYDGENVHVSYGIPGTYQPDDLVAVMGSRTVNNRGPMSTGRLRDETVETIVLFSCQRNGDYTQQQVATERAFELLDMLQDYLRTGSQITLTDTTREARVTEHELDEVVAQNQQGAVIGRRAIVAAVITTVTRV